MLSNSESMLHDVQDIKQRYHWYLDLCQDLMGEISSIWAENVLPQLGGERHLKGNFGIFQPGPFKNLSSIE